jgi:Zn-dependent peptidase ImmA (M78 family)
MLRESLQISARAEPETILTNWGVKITGIRITGGGIDAIAIWGGNRIPTVLLNEVGPRARTPTGRRSTLAHEICHLLVDIDGALPAAEVLGGNIPHLIEQRANAFAAEFLLPRSHAKEVISQELNFVHSHEERLRSIGRAVQSMSSTYGASHETVAWQILNSGIVLKSSEQLVLREKLKSIIDPYKSSTAWFH